jgi:hypothetical protein
MNFFRRGSSRWSSKGIIGNAPDRDLNIPRRTEVRSCEWPHNASMDEAEFHQDECDQYHILTNSFVQNFHFMRRLDIPMVCFDLYAEHHEIPLAEFCEICLIPSDGDLREPRPEEFDGFLRTLTVGEFRGMSKARVTSLHFPAVH